MPLTFASSSNKRSWQVWPATAKSSPQPARQEPLSFQMPGNSRSHGFTIRLLSMWDTPKHQAGQLLGQAARLLHSASTQKALFCSSAAEVSPFRVAATYEENPVARYFRPQRLRISPMKLVLSPKRSGLGLRSRPRRMLFDPLQDCKTSRDVAQGT